MDDLKDLISQHQLIFMDENDNPIEIKDCRVFKRGLDMKEKLFIYADQTFGIHNKKYRHYTIFTCYRCSFGKLKVVHRFCPMCGKKIMNFVNPDDFILIEVKQGGQ